MLLDYNLPTHVIMASDALAQNSQLLTQFGEHALLVMDAAMHETHPAKVETLFALEFNHIKRTIYTHTRKTAPGITSIESGAALARECGADFVMAVGCDATLEMGKAIAVLAVQDIAEATLLATEDIVPLPVVCIPTEPGSGTEVTPEIHAAQSGLGRLTLVRNPLVTPQLAFMDARYSEWMDIRVIQSHYMKTMGRAIEAIISETANPLSDAMAIGALGALANMRAIVLNASRVDEKGVKQGFSIHDREQLMLISNQVGLAVALSGGANILEALASLLTYVSKLHLGEAYGLVMPPLVDILTLRVPLLGDVVLQSLGFRRFEDLEDFLWELIDEIVPITTDDLERCANAAANNPLVKGGALTLEFKDIAACYEHLVADDEDLIVEEDDDDEEIFDEE